MSGRYIDVVVEAQPEIPDGCELRFHAVGEARPVRRIKYEPLIGPEGEIEFEVEAASGEPAQAVPVDDSSAGTSVLIYGDSKGIRLRQSDNVLGPIVVEPYLLLAPEAIVE
jgi:hypothetical protein